MGCEDRDRSPQSITGPKNTPGSPPETEFVQVPSNIIRIVSGSDRVIVEDDTAIRQYYVIEKIYKLNGSQQAEEIKELLRRQ